MIQRIIDFSGWKLIIQIENLAINPGEAIPMRAPPKVQISRSAFFSMVLAAVETFKRGCLGVVIGRAPTPKRNRFLIINAFPHQIVSERRNDSITESETGERRLKKIYSKMPRRYAKLGSFHSHTEWGSERRLHGLSETDIKDAVNKKAQVELLVCISSRYRGSVPWEYQPDGSVSGSLWKYNIALYAYGNFSRKKDSVPVALTIVAPSAIKFFNHLQKPH